MQLYTLSLIYIGRKMKGVFNMIDALFLIPAFIAGYYVCYVAMTYKVDQDK